MNQEQLFYRIIYYAAPTLSGKKAATLINLKDASEPLNSLWHKHKHKLEVNYIEIKVGDESTLVLLYNPQMIKNILSIEENRHFLKSFGYGSFESKDALNHLKSRFKEACPHEVGIFLGYPLHDVKCFATCEQKKCLAVGYWKVFDHLDAALETFSRFDREKAHMLSKVESGLPPSEVLRMALGVKEVA